MPLSAINCARNQLQSNEQHEKFVSLPAFSIYFSIYMYVIFIFCYLFVFKAKKANAGGDAASQKSDESGGGESKLKHQSVLQTKLTRLAIQIGYAG